MKSRKDLQRMEGVLRRVKNPLQEVPIAASTTYVDEVEEKKIVNKSHQASNKNIHKDEQTAIISTYKGNLNNWLKANRGKTKSDYNSLNREEVEEVHNAMSGMSDEEKQEHA